MPELPEVETVRRELAAALLGRAFTAVERVEPFMLRDTTAEQLFALLPEAEVQSISRQGKFLVLGLSGGLFLTIHLGMTGQLLVLPLAAELPRHARYSLRFAGEGEPERRLVFADMRKFGRVHLTEGGPAARLEAMGPDALEGAWGPKQLAKSLAGRRAPLKAFLLDQRHLAGIGNIYADEILFQAGLSPLRPAGELRPAEVRRLAVAIREKLEEGVRLRGCSISDYVDTKGRRGSFQDSLQAYGRHGEPCPRCGRPLVRTLVAGRGTAYCAHCQR